METAKTQTELEKWSSNHKVETLKVQQQFKVDGIFIYLLSK